MSSYNESSNDLILYELLEYFVRKQDPELIKCKNDAAILPTTGTIKNALKYLNNRYSLPESISQQISLTLPWKFAVGDCGRLLAVLQENVIEIRKAKDEYSSVVGKASVPKDAFPQWRKLAWSPDGTILVLASSNGSALFYNSLGNNVFNISPKTVAQCPHILEAGDAVASMLFLKPRTDIEKWAYEFILITYSGSFSSYSISPVNGYCKNYVVSLGNFYKNGINAVAYDMKHDLFYVAGNTLTQKLTSTSSESGLTSWRPLNDYPYFQLSCTFDNNTNNKSRFSIWNLIPTLSLQMESIIFKIRISPDRESLVCLHTDGSVSLWRLPNLILQHKWKLSEQPDYNTPNPLGTTKCKKFPLGLTEHHPMDIGWWSEQAIIIARYSGSTSVCSIKNFKNLLGTSPEFLAGQPQISELGTDRGFLCLDCETYVTSKKRSREPNSEGQISEASSESEKEDDELEPVTILSYTTNLVQSTLYSITDIERFQPKRKKSKVLYRTYRILGLKSTTPEELYSRKIDIEEYEEALALANTYNLDTDLVYQTQWRKSELSLNAIQEHLSKVAKRSWVLNECVTRVPDTMEAARELLNFGLKGANLETLVAIGTCDNGKFVLNDADENWEDLDESTVSLKQVQKVNQILEKIDMKNLSEAQKDLIKYRKKLLGHLDKLLTYEIILEPPLKYSKKFYEEFRQLSALENAIRFAKNSDCRGVEIMFTYYWESLFPHWLAIISFFPETLNPLDYEKLLPECDSEGQLFLLYQRELRQKDWCERNEFNEIIHTEENNEAQFLYDSDPSLAAYRNIQLTPDLLRKWYKSRAYEIEKNSYMIDNALQLVKIAKSHNINGLEELLLDLEVLYDLVYKVYLEDISLDRLQELSHLERIKLLMSTSDEKSFVDNIKNLLLPFIKTRHQYLGGDIQKHLLHDYLICLSKDDLKLLVKFFEYLKLSQDREIIQICDDASELATNCIYACNDLDMHQNAKYILDTIPKDRDGKRIGAACTLLEDLERELEYAQVLSKYGVKTTLNYINKNKNNPEIVKLLLIQMARNLNKIIPPPDEKQWAQLLNDMLEIHGQLFTCIDIEICFEICVSARLVSGIKSNIQNCAALIETKKNEQSLLKVSYEKAVGLILDASKEYFNSSKSLTDPSMELAKACLHLIADDNIQIKQEYDLINSLQILNEFNVDILPLQVRLTQERLKLIEECLIRREEAYKCRQRLLTLANYLRIEENNSRALEGKVLELIAKRAFEVKDYTVCATTCEQLMQNSYIPAWTIALDIGYCEEFRDLKTRQKCLWFTVNNGPSDILGKTLEQLQLIEIQMLHKNLEMWMPANDQGSFNDEGDSEDEFIDAMTTPQVEIKEFVPKVLETSTEIVKSSANIMKESTFSLIKGISDTNFWKSKLKFNFGSPLDNEAHEDENESERTNYIQSFPCFYGSLHEKCKISNFDTKYMKYSMPDIPNVKLKCCQALLRIAVLSEYTCYKKEVSDISHLLLECAKHTIPEDWLLGIAYLLSLNKSYIPDAQSIFMDLPETDLWIQTATYYYSLELHKALYTNFENLYLCDPLDLISKMAIEAQTCKECNIQMSLQFWQRKLFGDLKDIKLIQSKKIGINCAENTTNDNPDPDASTSITENSIKNTDSEVISSEQKDTVEESNLKEEIEWTDDWKDFSDDDTGYIKNKKDTSYESFSLKERNYLELDISKCITEKDYFEFFRKAFEKIRNEKDYQVVKRLLLDCPKFVDPEFTVADSHPILKMIEITNTFITKKNTLNYEKNILQEYRELVEALTSTENLKEFLEKTESQRPIEHNIYIRLCTEDPLLYNEAVDIIKEKCEDITLPSPILEEIFLKNLTASFNPDHIVYKQIIEHVFTNCSLINIEENANVLIRELKRQKHIGNALHIIKLMEAVPPSLTTFESCLHLLSRK